MGTGVGERSEPEIIFRRCPQPYLIGALVFVNRATRCKKRVQSTMDHFRGGSIDYNGAEKFLSLSSFTLPSLVLYKYHCYIADSIQNSDTLHRFAARISRLNYICTV